MIASSVYDWRFAASSVSSPCIVIGFGLVLVVFSGIVLQGVHCYTVFFVQEFLYIVIL